MSESTLNNANAKVRDPRREIARALALLFGFTFVLFGLERLIPAASGYSQGLLAFALLLIPGFVLRKSGTSVDDLGVAVTPWSQTLKLALPTMLIVFSVFGVGYHFYQTEWRGAEAHYSLDRLGRYGDALTSRPSNPCESSKAGPVAWIDGPPYRLWVVGAPKRSMSVRMEPAPPYVKLVQCSPDGTVSAAGRGRGKEGWLRSGRHRRGLMVPLGAGPDFKAEFQVDGRVHSAPSLRVGRPLNETQELEGSRSMGWLFVFILTQLLLVALPEEWFFRGYLQTRLDGWLGTRWNLLGAQLGWGWILSAAAFALLHPILIPGPHRLLVFFPALLFGWLRARGGNIGAAMVVHAGSNILLAILSRMFVMG